MSTRAEPTPAVPLPDRPGMRERAAGTEDRWWWLVLALLLVAGAILLLSETRGTTFWADEWQWILTRRGGGLATLLDPHNSHFSLVPVLVYKLLFAIVGLRHYWPYRVIGIGTHLLCVVLVFVYARPRVGGYLATIAAALILFFGPGWQNIMWPFQMAWLIAIGSGIGALLALERRDRAGDIVACVLLGISLASSGVGLAVAIGVVVEVLQRRRIRDLWIVAIPIVLYGAWWLGYQQTTFNRHSLVLLERFVANSAGGAVSSLTGLATVDVFHDTGSYINWGAPLLALLLLTAGWWLHRLGRIPGRVVTLASILLGFWLLTGIGRAYVSLGSLVIASTGDESRYLYVGAVFLLLLAVELARGYTPSLRVGLVLGVLAVAAIASNLGTLRDASRLLRSQAQITQAELGTMNLARSFVSPAYVSNGFIFGVVTARQWFGAQEALGSPAASPAQIATFPDYAREAADSQLLKIGELRLENQAPAAPRATGTPPTVDTVTSGTASISSGCLIFRPSGYTAASSGNALQLAVPPRGVSLSTQGAPATISARRFSSQFQPLGTLSPHSAAAATVVPDPAALPWHLQIAADGPVSVCARG